MVGVGVGAAVDDVVRRRTLKVIVECSVGTRLGPLELLIVGVGFGGYLGFEEVELGLAEEDTGVLECLGRGCEDEEEGKDYCGDDLQRCSFVAGDIIDMWSGWVKGS
jgi:hypothetical protein